MLEKMLGEYIEPVAHSLQVSFHEEKIRTGSNEYNQKNIESFRKSIQELDTQYGFDIRSEIRAFEQERIGKGLRDISREDLSREMGQRILLTLSKHHPIPDGTHLFNTIRNGNLSERSKIGKRTETILHDGTKKDAVDILLAYHKVIVSFQGTEKEIRESESMATSNGIISNVASTVKNVLGIDQLKSEFDYLKSEDIEKKLQESSLGDMVIMAGQLAQIIPFA